MKGRRVFRLWPIAAAFSLRVEADDGALESMRKGLESGAESLSERSRSLMEEIGDTVEETRKPEWRRFLESPVGLLTAIGAVGIGTGAVVLFARRRKGRGGS